MSHPYTGLSATAFWRSGVVTADRDLFPGLYAPKFAIGIDTKIATMGSCFAQHISHYLRKTGCLVLDAEPAPRAMTPPVAARFGYGLFSGRYGNIYTSRQLLDLLREIAAGGADRQFVWEKSGRFYDAFRPTVEPEGMDSADEVLLHRDYHLERTAQLLRQTDVLIFTLGLTETWADRGTGRVFPVCPGVVAGRFDPALHCWLNLTHADVLDDLTRIRALLQRFNPGMKLLLTVSPVPLTATASGAHVLAASSLSKSVLRAAVGECVAAHEDVDYVPSYELITHPAAGGPWFDANLRHVSAAGVDRVMRVFLAAHGLAEADRTPETDPEATPDSPADDAVCDEVLLDAFAGGAPPL